MISIGWRMLLSDEGKMSQELRGRAAELIRDGILANRHTIEQKIKKLLLSIFLATDVARSLRGAGSEDLGAHLGLTDRQSVQLHNALAAKVSDWIAIDAHRFAVSISAVSADWPSYLALPNASYVSHPSEIRVPVLEWLLIDPNIDIGQAQYYIKFGHGEMLNGSRSGRAVMRKIVGDPGDGSPYLLPAIVSGGAGKNFIEYAFAGQEVAEQVMALALSSLAGNPHSRL